MVLTYVQTLVPFFKTEYAIIIAHRLRASLVELLFGFVPVFSDRDIKKRELADQHERNSRYNPPLIQRIRTSREKLQ
jgi:hypothetical protein